MIKLFLLVALAHQPVTAFIYRENNPSALFHYRCAVADEFPPGNLSNPAFLPLWSKAYFSSAYSKPYMLDELNAYDTRAGYASGDAGFQASMSSFGIDEYREETLEGNFGFRPWDFLAAGIGFTGYRLSIDTDELSHRENISDLRMGLLLIPAPWLKIGYLQENAVSLAQRERRDLLYPDWSLGISLKPAQGAALIWNLNRGYYGYTNSFSFSANILPFLGLRAGYSRETTTYSAAVIILYKKLHLSYGMSFHSYLGSTHSVALTLCGTDYSLEEIRYTEVLPSGKSKSPSANLIDINTCTAGELEAVPVLPAGMADRIIKYRQMIGPLSEKSLFQIGLSGSEVSGLQDYVCGLAPDETDRWKHRQEGAGRKEFKSGLPGYTAAERREIFTKLLQAGVPAGTAMRVTDLMKDRTKSRIIEEVRNMQDIPQQTRLSIIGICGSLR